MITKIKQFIVLLQYSEFEVVLRICSEFLSLIQIHATSTTLKANDSLTLQLPEDQGRAAHTPGIFVNQFHPYKTCEKIDQYDLLVICGYENRNSAHTPDLNSSLPKIKFIYKFFVP
jgi:hypothetical protein